MESYLRTFVFKVYVLWILFFNNQDSRNNNQKVNAMFNNRWNFVPKLSDQSEKKILIDFLDLQIRIFDSQFISYFLRSSILYILFLLLFALPAIAQDFSEEKSIPEDAVVYMERTQCYGTCPIYTYYVLEDGTAKYIGKEHVEKTGTYYTTLSPDEMEDLINLFYKYDFFKYENRYVDLISDLPTTYIYFSHNGEEKKITDYHGAPESLKKLEKEVDNFMESLEWEKKEK